MADVLPKNKSLTLCHICAQPTAKNLKCVKCKTPYCSVECQTLDWKERGHKKTCKRLVKEAKGMTDAPRNGAVPPSKAAPPVVDGPARGCASPSKAAPPVVDGPPRGRADIARAKAAAAATTAIVATPAAAGDEDETRCPICLEEWDVNSGPGTTIRTCCCKTVCTPCHRRLDELQRLDSPCPLCRIPAAKSGDEILARLRSKVESGNRTAMWSLGGAYFYGHLGLVPSKKRGMRLYERAAALGEVNSLYNIGNSYRTGDGVKLDKKKAVKYYRMAADRGLAVAQDNLGLCYLTGEGAARDEAEGVRLFRLAAEKGLANAECNLGEAYGAGRGIAQDAAEARRWFERAAARGHEKARLLLARTQLLARNQILRSLALESGLAPG